MTIQTQIQKYIPLSEFDSIVGESLNVMNIHFISEIIFLKLQRPDPTPKLVIPKTVIGKNREKIISMIDTKIDNYNFDKNEHERIERNPFDYPQSVLFHILNAFCKAYENNVTGLIAYYLTPNPIPPPLGYPTTPIPKPITIPSPVNPSLEKNSLKAFFKQEIEPKLPLTFPLVLWTPQLELFIEGWIDFLISEVFV